MAGHIENNLKDREMMSRSTENKCLLPLGVADDQIGWNYYYYYDDDDDYHHHYYYY